MRHLLPAVFALSLSILPHSACAEDEISPANLEFFEKSVRPLLVKRCYKCHSAEENDGGLRLDSRASIMQGGDSGGVVTGTDPDRSRLIEAVRYQNRDLQMPPDNRLSDEEIAVLEKWVRLGTPDPRVEVPSTVGGAMGMTIEDGRKFWAFRPVSQAGVPDSWELNPVDYFVSAKLREASLKPAKSADRRTLIRRVTYDLTGLPPTPEEVEAFVRDKDDDAWLKVINRLLESPQYGVRWGRHWLDVARYADSNGLDENLAFGNAWRYRDYVVDAFNADMPYDQFVIEQLAGDLIPGSNQRTKTATGFLMLGAKVLAEPDLQKLIMDTVDEQIDSTGKVFMGLTLGCSRCHDHKFDPIRQSDYYALGAIFRSTRTFAETRTGAIKHWHEYEFTNDDEQAKLKTINAELARLKKLATDLKNAEYGRIRSEARAKAADYLVASVNIGVDTPLSEIAKVAEPLGLHPRILHHCRRHLAFNREDPFFAPWARLAEQGEMAVSDYYRPLFAKADQEWAAGQKQEPKLKALTDPVLEQARFAVNDASGFLAVPPKIDYALSAEKFAEYSKLADAARRYESAAPDVTAVMAVGEEPEIRDSLEIHIRGSHLNLGALVPRDFPEVMRVSSVRPVFPKKQSGRLQLAQWLTSTRHPLTARVFVNRVWGWHFGSGIVGTTENFGELGDRPTHPKLLDWLAFEFMQSGWSVKDLHRLILTSDAWMMASRHENSAEMAELDPENRLLWRFPVQRLEAEQIRDAVLATSGRLDASVGGKTVPLRNRQFVFDHTSKDHTKYGSLRRGLYLPIIRNNLYSMFQQFDYPDPTMPTGHRSSTVVAPQALLMMNSDLVMDSADALAAQLLGISEPSERIRVAYQRTLSRDPTVSESTRAIGFINRLAAEGFTAKGLSQSAEHQAWSVFCQSLYASNEFIYVR